MIKVKLGDMWISLNTGAIAALDTNKELYGRESLMLREAKNAIIPHIENFRAILLEKSEKYGVKNEQGNFSFDEESLKNLEAEMDEIGQKEVELPIDILPRKFILDAKITDKQIELLEKWLVQK